MSVASPVAVEIGRRLKTARVRLGLSQYGIAGSLGIAQPTVHSWERGARLPSIESLMRVAAYLDVPITDLLPVEATMRPDLVRLPNVRAMIAAFERTVEDLRRLLLVMAAGTTLTSGPVSGVDELLKPGGWVCPDGQRRVRQEGSRMPEVWPICLTADRRRR